MRDGDRGGAGRRGDGGERTSSPSCSGGACARPGNCFGAGTLVTTEDGLVAIESIEVGARVLARHEDTLELGWFRVSETFVRSSTGTLELAFQTAHGRDALVVTGEHPFHTASGWVSASDLAPGELIDTADGDVAEVVALTPLAQTQLVYNLEVESAHTYFVGEDSLWTHNVCNESLNGIPGTNITRDVLRTEHNPYAHERDPNRMTDYNGERITVGEARERWDADRDANGRGPMMIPDPSREGSPLVPLVEVRVGDHVRIIGPRDFTDLAERDLNQIAQTESGRRLIRSMRDAPNGRNVRIQPQAGAGGATDHATDGAVLSYNPRDTSLPDGVPGSRPGEFGHGANYPSDVLLFHELVHASDIVNGVNRREQLGRTTEQVQRQEVVPPTGCFSCFRRPRTETRTETRVTNAGQRHNELRTVGLGPYADDRMDFTERQYRGERGLVDRTFYTNPAEQDGMTDAERNAAAQNALENHIARRRHLDQLERDEGTGNGNGGASGSGSGGASGSGSGSGSRRDSNP